MLYQMFRSERKQAHDKEPVRKVLFKKRLADMFGVHEKRLGVQVYGDGARVLGYELPLQALEREVKALVPDYDKYCMESAEELTMEGIEVEEPGVQKRLHLFYARMFT